MLIPWLQEAVGLSVSSEWALKSPPNTTPGKKMLRWTQNALHSSLHSQWSIPKELAVLVEYLVTANLYSAKHCSQHFTQIYPTTNCSPLPCVVGAIIIPILQMRKLKIREVN